MPDIVASCVCPKNFDFAVAKILKSAEVTADRGRLTGACHTDIQFRLRLAGRGRVGHFGVRIVGSGLERWHIGHASLLAEIRPV